MQFLYLVLLVVAAAVIYLLWQNGTLKGLGLKGKPKMDPEQQLQQAIDSRTEALVRAQEALSKSGVVVRQCERDVQQSEADVNKLNAQIKASLKENNEGQARKLVERLQREEGELAAKRAALEEALDTHQFYASAVQTERGAIEEARREADRLSVRLQLAEADKAYRATADVGDKAAELRQQVQVAEISVKAARPGEDEFTKAAKAAEVDDRLAAFKQELGKE